MVNREFIPPRRLIALRKQLEVRIERQNRVKEMFKEKKNKGFFEKIKDSLH